MNYTRPANFQDVIARLKNYDPRTGKADCLVPGHKTPKGHIQITDKGDRAKATCFGKDHSIKEIANSLGFDSLIYKSNGDYRSSRVVTNGKACQPVKDGSKQLQNDLNTPLSTPVKDVNGLTLSQLAEAKNLQGEFLKSLGVTDYKFNRIPVVRIAYLSESGQEIAVRYRLSLTGKSRFIWRKGDHTLPYGLNHLEAARKVGWVLAVEGESDFWTALYHGIPAIGIPGKSNWKAEWADYFKGLQVFVWQEPEAEDFTLRLLTSFPDLRYIPAPEGIKDISEAHIQGIALPAWLEDLKARAEYGQYLKTRITNEQLATAYATAKPIIESEDPLELVKTAFRNMGYGGNLDQALITYIAATSRVLEIRYGSMLVHLLLIGPPSAGKSYTVGIVLKILPAEAYHIIDAGSPRALIYDDSDLQHKVVIFSEADSLPAGEDNPAASAMRNLLQDHHLHYQVVIRDSETGNSIVREIDKPGPTVLITTSTKSLGTQLMTRMFSLEVLNSEDQIKAALEAQGQVEVEGVKIPDNSLIAFQQYLQLKAPIKVLIPYARELAQAMGKVALSPRISRDYSRLLSLIKSVAAIRQYHRKLNAEGQIIATIEDYRTVRELVNDMYIDSSTGVTSEVRNLVETVIRLNAELSTGSKVNNSLLSRELKTNATQVKRWAGKAQRMGWITNREQRKGYPADYTQGEPMPETEGLPLADTLTRLTPLNTPLLSNSEANNGMVDTLTPLTDGNIPTTNGLPADILDIWQQVGKPIIHLGAGENVEDLEKLLKFSLNERQIKALNDWYSKNKNMEVM